MAQRIMCTVSNCHYWKDGNECAAEEILVTSDSFANYSPRRHYSKHALRDPDQHVHGNCLQDLCRTWGLTA